jgi:hypothetical protein
MVLKPLKYGNRVLWPLYYGAKTTQIWCYHHSNFKFSKISIWYYDYSKMVMSPFRLFNFSSSRKILEEYLYTVKIILNSDGTVLFQKGFWSYKYYLFRRDIYYRRDYVLNTFYNSEGTLYWIGTKVIRTLLILKGQKREKRSRIVR